MVNIAYYSRFFLIKSPENCFFSTRRTGRSPEEVAAKMAAAQGDSDVIFLRGGSSQLRKAPRTCQSDFNYLNKNNCKGKMIWLSRSAAGFSGIVVMGCNYRFQSHFSTFLRTSLLQAVSSELQLCIIPLWHILSRCGISNFG